VSFLDEAFRGAFDCSSGGQVCTNLTQLRRLMQNYGNESD
jgi:hypothetical protein